MSCGQDLAVIHYKSKNTHACDILSVPIFLQRLLRLREKNVSCESHGYQVSSTILGVEFKTRQAEVELRQLTFSLKLGEGKQGEVLVCVCVCCVVCVWVCVHAVFVRVVCCMCVRVCVCVSIL